MADNFLGRIALDAFRTGIPACHNAVRVEHAKRILGHARDEQAKLPLAFPDCILGGPPFRDVAGYLGEPLKLTIFIADRVHNNERPEAAAVLSDAPTFALE